MRGGTSKRQLYLEGNLEYGRSCLLNIKQFLRGVLIHPDLDFIMSEMKNFKKPWFISGGWVIDIALGIVTREHDDLDICIYREDANEVLRYFEDWEIKVAIPGEGFEIVSLGNETAGQDELGLYTLPAGVAARAADLIVNLLVDPELRNRAVATNFALGKAHYLYERLNRHIEEILVNAIYNS